MLVGMGSSHVNAIGAYVVNHKLWNGLQCDRQSEK